MKKMIFSKNLSSRICPKVDSYYPRGTCENVVYHFHVTIQITITSYLRPVPCFQHRIRYLKRNHNHANTRLGHDPELDHTKKMLELVRSAQFVRWQLNMWWISWSRMLNETVLVYLFFLFWKYFIEWHYQTNNFFLELFTKSWFIYFDINVNKHTIIEWRLFSNSIIVNMKQNRKGTWRHWCTQCMKAKHFNVLYVIIKQHVKTILKHTWSQYISMSFLWA